MYEMLVTAIGAVRCGVNHEFGLPRFLFATLALLVGLTSPVWEDDVLLQARTLVDTQKPQDALRLLEPLKSQRANDEEFQYVLGLALVDLGRAQEAETAFRNVLVKNPSHAQARAELGRALFQQGKDREAQHEFETVLVGPLPENVRTNIELLLAAIKSKQRI